MRILDAFIFSLELSLTVLPFLSTWNRIVSWACVYIKQSLKCCCIVSLRWVFNECSQRAAFPNRFIDGRPAAAQRWVRILALTRKFSNALLGLWRGRTLVVCWIFFYIGISGLSPTSFLKIVQRNSLTYLRLDRELNLLSLFLWIWGSEKLIMSRLYDASKKERWEFRESWFIPKA